MARRDETFTHHFEGPEVLDGLLELAQCPLTFEGVVEAMKAAMAEGQSAQECIPQLFENTPRFPNPEVARKFFQNMLGLWDELSLGKSISMTTEKRVREKKVRPELPGPFSDSEPSVEYVNGVVGYLKQIDRKEMLRWQHKFENRQDVLLNFLEEQGLSDEAWSCTQQLLFEVFCVLELGIEQGVSSASAAHLSGKPGKLPSALLEHLKNGMTETETASLTASEKKAVKTVTQQGAWALWNARRH